MLFGYTQPTALGLQSGFDASSLCNKPRCMQCLHGANLTSAGSPRWLVGRTQLICIDHPTGWTTGCKYVYTMQLLGEGLDETNVFDSSNPSSNRWSNSQMFVYTIQSVVQPVGQSVGQPIVSVFGVIPTVVTEV